VRHSPPPERLVAVSTMYRTSRLAGHVDSGLARREPGATISLSCCCHDGDFGTRGRVVTGTRERATESRHLDARVLGSASSTGNSKSSPNTSCGAELARERPPCASAARIVAQRCLHGTPLSTKKGQSHQTDRIPSLKLSSTSYVCEPRTRACNSVPEAHSIRTWSRQ